MVSLDELTARFASIPERIEETLAQPLPETADLSPRLGFDVTGVGASEFPALVLVQALLASGIRARFCPISSFVVKREVPPETALVVFSQGLSPNGRLPLRSRSNYSQVVLFTATSEETDEERALLRDSCEMVLEHAPESESGTLVRLVGPTCAAVLSLCFASGLITERLGRAPGWQPRLGDLPACYRSASRRVPPLSTDPAGCLALGHELGAARALMWKWQESLYTPLRPVFDVLSFAHGPLQSFTGKKATFFTLEPGGQSALFANLDATLDPELHRVHRLTSSLPAPLSALEYDARVSSLCLAEMGARGIDPSDWPGKKADGPLYSVGS